jgi:hypothetical protein
MADTTSVAGGRQPSIPNTYNPIAGVSFPPGTPVRQDLEHDDTVLPGKADVIDTAIVTGIAVGAGIAPWGQRTSRVPVQYIGPLTLSTDQWDEVTGDEGGLVRGVAYYLRADVPGKLTGTAPSTGGGSGFDTPVGVALSETTLLILLNFPRFNGVIIGLKPPTEGGESSSSSSSSSSSNSNASGDATPKSGVNRSKK